MKTITEITEFNKAKNKVLFDDGSFLVLYKGMVSTDSPNMSDEDYDEYVKQMLTYAKRRAMNLLVRKDYTVGKLKKKLEDDGYNSEIIDATFDFLNAYHYLDDERVAENLVKYYRDSKSIAEIRFLLKKQDLSDETIETAITLNYFSSEEVSMDDAAGEVGVIKKQLLKLGMTPEKIGEMDFKAKQKLAAKFFRKGFKSENIREAMRLTEFE